MTSLRIIKPVVIYILVRDLSRHNVFEFNNGDTLFAGGCGRLFEGSAAQMRASLNRLAALPVDTRVYCAHEYTLSNLRFAAAAEPDNPQVAARLQHVQSLRAENKPSVPSLLADELATNPFLRSDQHGIVATLRRECGLPEQADADACFVALREWKNRF